MTWLAVGCWALSVVGLAVWAAQWAVARWHLRRPPQRPVRRAALSVLKPLCGADDALAQNLESFGVLDGPDFEVLLGVRDAQDAALPYALEAIRRWPHRFRLVLQQGAPGWNPKVNQLITLARHARHDLLVISDSNVRVAPGYLEEQLALFEDPQVGLVMNPVGGAGHQTLASLMDNLHLAGGMSAGQIAAKLVGKRDLVIGKGMALRRSALDALGGFERYADVLAEDHVLGLDVVRELGLHVALARTPVVNVSVRRTLRSFWQRYARWAVMQRTAVSLPLNVGQAVVGFPVLLAGLACALGPSPGAALGFATVVVVKLALEWRAAALLGLRASAPAVFAAALVKDVLLAAAWLRALFVREIDWRGTRLRVVAGSRLVPPERAQPELSPAQAGATP